MDDKEKLQELLSEFEDARDRYVEGRKAFLASRKWIIYPDIEGYNYLKHLKRVAEYGPDQVLGWLPDGAETHQVVDAAKRYIVGLVFGEYREDKWQLLWKMRYD